MPSGAAAGVHRRARPRWPQLYFLLAAFDLITVAFSLVLNHQIRFHYARSVEINQFWSRRADAYGDLGQLAGMVDAPGNDVFDSLDVERERQRMEVALQSFQAELAKLRAELRLSPPASPAQVAPLLENFHAVDSSMDMLTSEADLIFSYFAQGEPSLAARRMATMDHRYAEVLKSLDRLREQVGEIQEENFAQQEVTVSSLAKFEYAIALLIVVMIAAAITYGHRVSRQVEADARERERSIERLRDAEARTRSIVETAADGILTFDEQGVIESANPAAERIFRAGAAELLGQTISYVVPHLARRAPSPTMAGLPVEAGQWTDDERVGRRADGTLFPMEFAIGGIRIGDRQIFNVVVRDITERRHAEEARAALVREQAARAEAERTAQVREQAARAEIEALRALDQLKDELVSVVSHELRTPLASLVGFTEILLTREFPEPRRRQFLQVMHQEGRRLARLIDDLLDLQRMVEGREQLLPAVVDLSILLEEAVAAAGEDARRPILWECPADLPLVLADAARIRQVLANLLSNARKYSPAGGSIALSARVAAGVVEVRVQDHGLGIPSEAIARVFEKFYRVDMSDRREIGGTGLGLTICQKIVEAHGGRIWAESAGPGCGSTFVFTLRLAAAGVLDAASLLAPAETGRNSIEKEPALWRV